MLFSNYSLYRYTAGLRRWRAIAVENVALAARYERLLSRHLCKTAAARVHGAWRRWGRVVDSGRTASFAAERILQRTLERKFAASVVRAVQVEYS